MGRRKKKSKKKGGKRNISINKRRIGPGNKPSLPRDTKGSSTESSGSVEHSAGIVKDAPPIPQPGILSEKPTLSVCMIVRDEEMMLPRCLKSLHGITDEVIVVDTGSKDKTISIAQEFGAKIFHFEWCDDFAAARDEGLRRANGDWILQIDADEELLSNSLRPLRKSMFNPWCLLYDVTVDNGPAYPERFLKPGRLFRNHPQIRYAEPYHETVRSSVHKLMRAEPHWQIVHEPRIVIRHYGWDESQMKERGKYTRELRILEAYCRGNPNHHRLATRLGEVYVCLGRYDDAIDVCKEVLATSPDDVFAYHALGAAYLQQNKLDEAVCELKRALAIAPDFALARYRLGAAYSIKGMFDEAIRELKQILATHTDFALVHHWLGVTYTNKGMFDEAIVEYKRALTIVPDLALAHYGLGVAFNNKRMFPEAIVEYKQALTIDPNVDDFLSNNLVKAHTDLGLDFHKKGMLDEAIDAYQDALAINPDDADAHFNMGVAYRGKGMLDEATAEYKAALAVDSRFAEAHNNLAIIYYSDKEYDLAVKHCDKAMELGFKVHPQFLQDIEPYRQ